MGSAARYALYQRLRPWLSHFAPKALNGHYITSSINVPCVVFGSKNATRVPAAPLAG